MRSLFTVAALLWGGLFLSLHAQTDYLKYSYGDVTAEDLQLTVAPNDSAAEAYVLFDLLRVRMIQTPDGYPRLQEFRHRQVKLLRESSFDRADIEIPYYRETQKISDLKAQIHLPNGKRIKVTKRDMIKESYDEDRNIYKFTFPNVEEGAVLEYVYQITSENITIPSRYYFQEDIPVRWAEYRAFFPSYFNYISLSNALNRTVNEVTTVNGYYGSNQVAMSKLRYAYGDLKPYTDQPYVNNFRDYIPHVRLQLASVQFPGQQRHKVFSDWQQTTKELDDYLEFGKAFRNRSNYNRVWKAVEPMVEGLATEAEKIGALYNFVAGRMSWNGDFSIFSDRTPNKVFDAAEGTSGELSIMLLALLREAGIEAQPVLVPLRNSGTPVELYPLMSQFGHTMVLAATTDGQSVLLDPNDISRPPGVPRFNALNGRAFVANPEAPRWIDVAPPAARQVVMADAVLDDTGLATVAMKTRFNSYYAQNARQAMKDLEDNADLPIVRMAIKNFPEMEVVSHTVDEASGISGPFSMDMELSVPMGQAVDDYLYVQPILCPVLSEELADVDQRLYPVDFGHPWTEQYVTTLKLPSGYEVEELPESMRMVSEDGSMTCILTAEAKAADELFLNFKVQVKKAIYQPKEYVVLKQMFQRIIELQESTIVLKKAKK